MIALKMKENTVHIKNNPIKVSQTLDFQAIDSLSNLKIVKLSQLGKIKKIISSVPSIDTTTCALQTTKFNMYAQENLQNYIVITISKDLPFAQKRFCDSLTLNQNFHVWSDYRNDANNFANTTNLIIDEIQLLARTVMILDEDNKVLYQQIVEQISDEPNYDEVIAFIKTLEKH